MLISFVSSLLNRVFERYITLCTYYTFDNGIFQSLFIIFLKLYDLFSEILLTKENMDPIIRIKKNK